MFRDQPRWPDDVPRDRGSVSEHEYAQRSCVPLKHCRVSLARALYSYAGTILLDEPFAHSKFQSYTCRRDEPHFCLLAGVSLARKIWGNLRSGSLFMNRTVIVRRSDLSRRYKLNITPSQLSTSMPQIFDLGSPFTVKMKSRRIESQGLASFVDVAGHAEASQPNLGQTESLIGLEGHIRERTEESPTVAPDPDVPELASYSNPLSQTSVIAHHIKASSPFIWIIIMILALGRQSL